MAFCVEQRRPGPGRPPKLTGNKNFRSQSSYRNLRSTLDAKLNRVQSQEMIRTQRLLEREKKRLRKQRMNFVKKRDDEQFPGKNIFLQFDFLSSKEMNICYVEKKCIAQYRKLNLWRKTMNCV